jgi:hypothetical protein
MSRIFVHKPLSVESLGNLPSPGYYLLKEDYDTVDEPPVYCRVQTDRGNVCWRVDEPSQTDDFADEIEVYFLELNEAHFNFASLSDYAKRHR